MLGVETFIRVGTTGAFPPLEIGDVVVAMASAGWTGLRERPRGGEPTAPTADLDVVLALRDAAQAEGLTTHVGPIVTGDTFYGDPDPAGVTRWGRRGYLSVEMETAALFLLAMRERAKGRPVRAGSILTVSDVLFYPDVARGGRRPAARRSTARRRTRSTAGST